MSQEQENPEGYTDPIDKKQEERKTTEDEKMDAESGEDAHLGLLDQPLVVEGKRKRRSVQSFQSPDSAPSKKKKVEVEEGSGVKLGDITSVDAALNKKKTDELRPLYKLLFDQQGTRMEMKRNIRAFSGFPFSEGSDDYKRRVMSLERLQKTALSTHYCQSLGLSVAGNKKELTNRIMKFLMKPEGDKPTPSRTMAGRKASKGRKGGKQASGREGGVQEEKMDDESADKQGSNTTQDGAQVEDKGGDQQVSEGGDRQVSEGGDQQISEGGDQSVSEGGDQSVSEGGDQSVSEGGDQSVSEGGDRQVSEGGDRQVSEGGDRQVSEGGDQQISEGGDQSVSEGGDQSVSEGGDQSVSEGGDQSVSEGGDRQVSEGGDQSVSEGGDRQVSEGGDQSVSEGGDRQVSEGGDRQVSEGGDRQVSEGGDQQVSEGGDQQVNKISLSADEGKTRDTTSFEPSDISVGRNTTPANTGCESQEGRTDETANREVASQKSVILEQAHHKQVVIAEQ